MAGIRFQVSGFTSQVRRSSFVVGHLLLMATLLAGCGGDSTNGSITASGFIEGEEVVIAPETSGPSGTDAGANGELWWPSSSLAAGPPRSLASVLTSTQKSFQESIVFAASVGDTHLLLTPSAFAVAPDSSKENRS